MNRLRHEITVSHIVTAQFVGNAPKEALCGLRISSGLQEHINDIAILVHCPPQIVELAIDLHEHLIDVEGVPITIVFLLQTNRVFWPKLVAPQADRFMAYGDASPLAQPADLQCLGGSG
jgi:hypothetical protein